MVHGMASKSPLAIKDAADLQAYWEVSRGRFHNAEVRCNPPFTLQEQGEVMKWYGSLTAGRTEAAKLSCIHTCSDDTNDAKAIPPVDDCHVTFMSNHASRLISIVTNRCF